MTSAGFAAAPGFVAGFAAGGAAGSASMPVGFAAAPGLMQALPFRPVPFMSGTPQSTPRRETSRMRSRPAAVPTGGESSLATSVSMAVPSVMPTRLLTGALEVSSPRQSSPAPPLQPMAFPGGADGSFNAERAVVLTTSSAQAGAMQRQVSRSYLQSTAPHSRQVSVCTSPATLKDAKGGDARQVSVCTASATAPVRLATGARGDVHALTQTQAVDRPQDFAADLQRKLLSKVRELQGSSRSASGQKMQTSASVQVIASSQPSSICQAAYRALAGQKGPPAAALSAGRSVPQGITQRSTQKTEKAQTPRGPSFAFSSPREQRGWGRSASPPPITRSRSAASTAPLTDRGRQVQRCASVPPPQRPASVPPLQLSKIGSFNVPCTPSLSLRQRLAQELSAPGSTRSDRRSAVGSFNAPVRCFSIGSMNAPVRSVSIGSMNAPVRSVSGSIKAPLGSAAGSTSVPVSPRIAATDGNVHLQRSEIGTSFRERLQLLAKEQEQLLVSLGGIPTSTPRGPQSCGSFRSPSGATTPMASFVAPASVGVPGAFCGPLPVPASRYVPDSSDVIDVAVSSALRKLDAASLTALWLRRRAPGKYEIDGRSVTITWHTDLVVREDDVPQADAMLLMDYLRQAANVANSLAAKPKGQLDQMESQAPDVRPVDPDATVSHDDERLAHMAQACREAGVE